jgi:hypothetical protein
MTITTRMDKIAAALGPDDDVPAIVIVVEDPVDGRWWQGEREIDRETLDPRTHVIVFRQRPDGPQ